MFLDNNGMKLGNNKFWNKYKLNSVILNNQRRMQKMNIENTEKDEHGMSHMLH
jgi:hypothetical protein